MLRMSESVDGASVAAAARAARARDQHLGAGRVGGEHRRDAERRRADQQHLAPADPVAERAHGDQRAGDHEAVDVDDPQQPGRARLQIGDDLRQGEIEDREVHRVDEARDGDDGEADPVAPGRLGADVGHVVFALAGSLERRRRAAAAVRV